MIGLPKRSTAARGMAALYFRANLSAYPDHAGFADKSVADPPAERRPEPGVVGIGDSDRRAARQSGHLGVERERQVAAASGRALRTAASGRRRGRAGRGRRTPVRDCGGRSDGPGSRQRPVEQREPGARRHHCDRRSQARHRHHQRWGSGEGLLGGGQRGRRHPAFGLSGSCDPRRCRCRGC